jgi:hypothetical protein
MAFSVCKASSVFIHLPRFRERLAVLVEKYHKMFFCKPGVTPAKLCFAKNSTNSL